MDPVRAQLRLDRREVGVEVLDHVLLDVARDPPETVGVDEVVEEHLRPLSSPAFDPLWTEALVSGRSRAAYSSICWNFIGGSREVGKEYRGRERTKGGPVRLERSTSAAAERVAQDFGEMQMMR
jgi:hypothetical protein